MTNHEIEALKRNATQAVKALGDAVADLIVTQQWETLDRIVYPALCECLGESGVNDIYELCMLCHRDMHASSECEHTEGEPRG